MVISHFLNYIIVINSHSELVGVIMSVSRAIVIIGPDGIPPANVLLEIDQLFYPIYSIGEPLLVDVVELLAQVLIIGDCHHFLHHF